MKEYPNVYLHVRDCHSGQEWVMPMRGNSLMCLRTQLRKWVKQEFCGECFLDGEIMPHLDGDYYGMIITDGRSPEDGTCWESGGFYLKTRE